MFGYESFGTFAITTTSFIAESMQKALCMISEAFCAVSFSTLARAASQLWKFFSTVSSQQKAFACPGLISLQCVACRNSG
jgi:hypothetical protein